MPYCLKSMKSASKLKLYAANIAVNGDWGGNSNSVIIVLNYYIKH